MLFVLWFDLICSILMLEDMGYCRSIALGQKSGTFKYSSGNRFQEGGGRTQGAGGWSYSVRRFHHVGETMFRR